jgi:hypothetical protein
MAALCTWTSRLIFCAELKKLWSCKRVTLIKRRRFLTSNAWMEDYSRGLWNAISKYRQIKAEQAYCFVLLKCWKLLEYFKEKQIRTHFWHTLLFLRVSHVNATRVRNVRMQGVILGEKLKTYLVIMQSLKSKNNICWPLMNKK